jgi:hypothetical protein
MSMRKNLLDSFTRLQYQREEGKRGAMAGGGYR